MSNVLAIAATTRTLRNLLLARMPVLDTDLSDLEVTLQPPDVARKGVTKAQLNLFLYQVVYNAAWRNLDMPGQVRPGESAIPALALNLHYLITAYGRGESDSEALSHRVLAAAMSTLYDRCILDGDDIRNALPDNDLASQIERVRIAPLTQSVEELSKLWTAFQTNYRVSVAYEAAVVLIDSQTPVRARLPVLRRGQDDRGVLATASIPPTLDPAVEYPNQQVAIRLGQDIVLTGRQLTTGAVASFSSPFLPAPVDLAPVAGDVAGTLRVRISDSTDDADAVSRWVPGQYLVALAVRPPGWPADHAPLPGAGIRFALAPTITVSPLTIAAGDLTLTVTCVPRLADSGQRVALVFNDLPYPAMSVSNPGDLHQPTTLVFKVPGVVAGSYPVRLRVDGVDSIPTDPGTVPLAFATNQTVIVT
jgi:Pvc16 N-terminal domain